jgi:hypothetical protein
LRHVGITKFSFQMETALFVLTIIMWMILEENASKKAVWSFQDTWELMADARIVNNIIINPIKIIRSVNKMCAMKEVN